MSKNSEYKQQHHQRAINGSLFAAQCHFIALVARGEGGLNVSGSLHRWQLEKYWQSNQSVFRVAESLYQLGAIRQSLEKIRPKGVVKLSKIGMLWSKRLGYFHRARLDLRQWPDITPPYVEQQKQSWQGL